MFNLSNTRLTFDLDVECFFDGGLGGDLAGELTGVLDLDQRDGQRTALRRHLHRIARVLDAGDRVQEEQRVPALPRDGAGA